MPKTYRCPACQNEVDRGATICSNASCRRELAFCSHCRDVTTFTLAEPSTGRFTRDHYRCDRCERLGVKCATWLMGAYCNGLARAGGSVDAPLCAVCLKGIGGVGKSVAVWALMGAFSGLVRRRPPG